MRKTVVVVPPVIVMVAPIRGNVFFEKFLQVLNESRFIFNGCECRRGAAHEQRRHTAADILSLYMFSHLGGDINDVAVAGGGFGNFLGANREHAISLWGVRPGKGNNR